MDDITHNCQRCHEIARDPEHHTCGLNAAGGLPANQPHSPQVDAPVGDRTVDDTSLDRARRAA